MFDASKLSEETRQYFESLPVYMKENILQSGYEFSSKEDLEKYTRTITEKQ